MISCNLIDFCFEGELQQTKNELISSNQEVVELKDRLWRQSSELDDLKTATALSEATRLDEVEQIRTQCFEEVATLQRLLKGFYWLLVVACCNECVLCIS